MKKSLAHTQVIVKLRKSVYREEWYLLLEAYPVFQDGSTTPKRTREYVNRTISTPIWDKSRKWKVDSNGKATYKPKRDLNPTSTFPPQNFLVIQHLQFLHIYCGYYKFSNSTELG